MAVKIPVRKDISIAGQYYRDAILKHLNKYFRNDALRQDTVMIFYFMTMLYRICTCTCEASFVAGYYLVSIPFLGRTSRIGCNLLTNKQTNKRTNKRTNKQTNEQTDRQINRQTNKQDSEDLPVELYCSWLQLKSEDRPIRLV